MTVTKALDGLNDALKRLEDAIEVPQDRGRGKPSGREEVHRLNLDRAELARKLDRSENTAQQLRDANREVSRRLIAAMEALRTVLERA